MYVTIKLGKFGNQMVVRQLRRRKINGDQYEEVKVGSKALCVFVSDQGQRYVA